MGVKKIFITLVTIVACVILGAFVLNVVMPSTTKSLTAAAEQMIYNATGMGIDINGDGTTGTNAGASNKTYGQSMNGASDKAVTGGTVNGYAK